MVAVPREQCVAMAVNREDYAEDQRKPVCRSDQRDCPDRQLLLAASGQIVESARDCHARRHGLSPRWGMGGGRWPDGSQVARGWAPDGTAMVAGAARRRWKTDHLTFGYALTALRDLIQCSSVADPNSCQKHKTTCG
jgi:hypothetical protein